MAVSAMLRTTRVEVAPGGAARCHVLVRNNSAVVDQFVFTVRGDVDTWTTVKPERVNLMPRQEVPVELTFLPPRAPDVLAGEHPFALQVSSREDPAGSVVQEGVVDVESFTEVAAGIVPVTSSARRVGKHTLAIDHLGNHPHGVEVIAEDPDAKLTFRRRPAAPGLTPGTTTFVKVRVRPRKYFWKGADRTHPFSVTVLAPGAEPIAVEAALNQKPLIPQRFFWLVTILFALLMILVMVVMLLLRQRPVSIAGPSPTVTSTPSSTASRPSTAVTTTAATTTASRTSVVRDGPNGGRNTPTAGVNTTTFTISAQAYPGAGGEPQTFSYVVPPGPRYRVLSVVLRNPAGDAGQVQIRHGNRVLGTRDLAEVARANGKEVTFRPENPPLVAPGERMTLAITCANGRDPCTPSGVFTAALVR